MPTQIQLPPSRIVWGNPAKSQPKRDQRTRQPIMKDGKAVEEWGCGVAIPKPAFNAQVSPLIQQEVRTGYPQGVPPNFSWKLKDGDGVDRTGKPYAAREGYAGHMILTIKTEAFAPPIYKMQPNGQYAQLQPHEIKTGDWVVPVVNFQLNIPQNTAHTPGLYVNPVAFLHVGYGQEIVNGPDPTTLFGQQPQFQLPPGASAVPLAPAGNVAIPGTMPGGPQMQPGGPGVQYPQAGPGYTPPIDPRFTGGGGGMPGQQPQQQFQPQPQQYQQQPVQQYTPQPGQQPMQPMQPMHQPQYAPQIQPAHDFVQNAGMQMPGQQPQQQFQPQPQQYQQQPVQQYAPQPGQQPQGGGMPGQMPGMMPQR